MDVVPGSAVHQRFVVLCDQHLVVCWLLLLLLLWRQGRAEGICRRWCLLAPKDTSSLVSQTINNYLMPDPVAKKYEHQPEQFLHPRRTPPNEGVDAPKKVLPVFAKENAEFDAAPNAGDDCTPNVEVVACCCPKVVCPNRLLPNGAETGWLAPNAGVELAKLKGED